MTKTTTFVGIPAAVLAATALARSSADPRRHEPDNRSWP